MKAFVKIGFVMKPGEIAKTNSIVEIADLEEVMSKNFVAGMVNTGTLVTEDDPAYAGLVAKYVKAEEPVEAGKTAAPIAPVKK